MPWKTYKYGSEPVDFRSAPSDCWLIVGNMRFVISVSGRRFLCLQMSPKAMSEGPQGNERSF